MALDTNPHTTTKPELKLLHRVIRQLAAWGTVSFFHRVHIIGGENVPQDGPLIVCAALR
jgi:glycerol-3-phosphate O-acyltransferase/dihydroxyacetone phosphate acyltransferase